MRREEGVMRRNYPRSQQALRGRWRCDHQVGFGSQRAAKAAPFPQNAERAAALFMIFLGTCAAGDGYRDERGSFAFSSKASNSAFGIFSFSG
jgi:hypothetical protein